VFFSSIITTTAVFVSVTHMQGTGTHSYTHTMKDTKVRAIYFVGGGGGGGGVNGNVVHAYSNKLCTHAHMYMHVCVCLYPNNSSGNLTDRRYL